MPTKRGNSKSNSKNPADWQKWEFCDIVLTDDEKARFKADWSKDPQQFLGLADETNKNGYKISLTYDQNNNCCIATLSCKEPSSPNFNYAMSARAADVWEALGLVLFKHYFCCDDEDWAAETRADGKAWG